ncbi:hypothetical protein OC861_000817 [Tilletia horrida]|nr:hypothetical protein OC845_001075 [Tilletia horrida]KAK0569548.1 hypothetical protein OC861_000817 [Tilletia horrida]
MPVAVLWDVDNCSPPTGMSGRDVALAIRKAIQDLSPPGVSEPIIAFKAYLELSSEAATSPAQVQLRSELQGSGVSLLDTPKSGRKQVADQMMITDLLAFAIDHPAPARIVLLSGDRDFAYALGTLRNRGFFITLITPPAHVAPILEASAHTVLRWRQDVLGIDYDKDGRPYTGARALRPETSARPAQGAKPTDGKDSAPTPRKPNQSSQAAAQSKPTPEVFKPLVDLLKQMRDSGVTRPLRSGVAAQLKQIDKDLYERAGASRWAEYAAVAEAAGIITLGGTGVSGHEWVSLAGAEDEAPNKQAAPASPSVAKAKASTYFAASGPSGTRPVIPPGTPTKPSSALTPSTSASTISSNSVKVDTPELRPFQSLIEILNSQRSIGISYPKILFVSRSIDRLIAQGVADPYRQAGVTNFSQYLAAAERAGVARAQGDAMKLHPKFVGAQTTAITPAVNRIPDTAVVAANVSGPVGAINKANTLASNIKTKIASAFSTPKLSEDEVRQALYKGLIECLREQRAEKHFYSADFFIQLVLARLPGGEKIGKSLDRFNAFLGEAERDGVVLLEPGFGNGRRHVRLAPKWYEAGTATESMGDDTLPVAGFELPPTHGRSGSTELGLIPSSVLPSILPNSDKSSNVELPPVPKLGGLESTTRNGSSGSEQFVYASSKQAATNEGSSSNTSTSLASEASKAGTTSTNTAAGPRDASSEPSNSASAAASERARFKPLVDALVHLRREYQIVYPSMEQLHAELRERASTPAVVAAGGLPALGLGRTGDAAGGAHSIEFVQWLGGAADLGLITIERYEDDEKDQKVTKARLRLADRYVEMFKL